MNGNQKDLKTLSLCGVEYSKDFAGLFNFVLNNGKRSKLRTTSKMKQYLIAFQEGTTLKKAQIMFQKQILMGFKFLDENGSIILEVGSLNDHKMIEVELKPHERIVGFRSRLGSNDKS